MHQQHDGSNHGGDADDPTSGVDRRCPHPRKQQHPASTIKVMKTSI